jgi:hypothetical protein
MKSMLYTNASTRGSIHDASENRTIPPTGHGAVRQWRRSQLKKFAGSEHGTHRDRAVE